MNINNGGLGFIQTLNNEEFKKTLRQSFDQVNNFSAKSIVSMDAVQVKMNDLIGLSAGFLSVQGASSFIQQMVKVRGEFEQLEIAFTTMLGSKEKADKLMMEIVDFAATTPFGLQSTSEATKMLLAYGESANTALDTIRKLGDIASGVGIPLKDMAYLYGTTMTQGRLYTQDLNQFLGRGIPMMDELAKIFGVNKNEVKALVEAGKVGFPEVQKAIDNLTASGSMFGGLMEAQSKSISGQIEQLKDAIDVMFNDLGKSAQPAIGSLINGASVLIENYEKIGKTLGFLITTYGVYRAALIANSMMLRIHQQLEVQNALAKMATATATSRVTVLTLLQMKAQAALNAVMMANPFILVGAAVIGLASAYILLSDNTTAAEKAQEAYNKTQEKVKSEIDETKKKAEEYINVLKDETTTVYQQIQAYKALQELRIKGLDGLSQEQIKLMEVNELKKLINSTSDDNNLKAQKSELKRLEEEIQVKEKRLQSLRQGSSRDQYEASRLTEELKESTEQYNLQYSTVTKMENEMKMANMTLEQQKAYWENIVSSTQNHLLKINEIKNKQSETKTILGINLGLVNETGVAFQMWNVNPLVAQLEQAKLELIQINQTASKPAEATKNKSFWEQQKKEASDARDALAYTQKGSKEWNELTQKINEANNALQAYNDSYKKPTATKPKIVTTKKADDPVEVFKKEISQIKEQYENYNKWVDTNDRFLLTQANALGATLKFKGETYLDFLRKQAEELRKTATHSETARKQLYFINQELQQQIDFSEIEEYKKGIEKQIDSAKSLLEVTELIQIAKAELEGKGDQASVDKMKFLDTKDLDTAEKLKQAMQSIVDNNRSEMQEMNAMFDEYYRDLQYLNEALTEAFKNEDKERIESLQIAIEERTKKFSKSTEGMTGDADYSELLRNYRTYSVKREEIENEFDKKIALARQHNNEELAQLLLQEQKSALKSLDSEILRKSQKWIKYFEDFSRKSSAAIIELIRSLESDLSNPSFTDGKSIEDIEALQNKLKELKSFLVKSDPFSAIGASFQKMISDFKEGKEFDFDNLKNGIEALKGSIEMVYGFADDLGVSISDSTKSAIQLGTDLFEAGSQIAEGIATKNPLKVVQGIVKGISSIINASDRKKERQIQKYKQAVDELSKSFRELEYISGKALGGDTYATQKQMMDNLIKQQAEYQKMINAERGKKKKDQGKIDEWEQAMTDASQRIQEIMDNIVQDVLQTNAKDLANTLGDALVSAFSQGEDAAKSFEKVVDDILKNAVLNQLKKQFLEKQLQGALDQLYRDMGGDDQGNFNWNGLTPEEQQAFRDKMREISENFTGMLGAYSDLFGDFVDPNEDSLQGAIKGVSEETASLIAGHMNAIRILQAELVDVSRNSNSLLVQQLDQLFRIEYNTRDIVPMLREIKTSLESSDDSARAWGH